MTKRSAQRAQFLSDVLTTAVEGGINYWSQVGEYRWFAPDLSGGTAEPGPGNTANAYVTVYEEGKGDGVKVGLDEIASALAKLTARDIDIRVAESYLKRFRQANRENDAGYLDALDADIVVQVAVLGGVVYG